MKPLVRSFVHDVLGCGVSATPYVHHNTFQTNLLSLFFNSDLCTSAFASPWTFVRAAHVLSQYAALAFRE